MNPEKPEKFWNEEDSAPDPIPKVKKPSSKLNIDGEKIRNGLGQLILTVVELLRELMEKQAVRRIEAGALSDDQVERLGNTFMKLKEEVNKLKDYFELDDEDLNLTLGPVLTGDQSWEGKASAVEILDRLLATGVVVRGDLLVSVAEVDLISLNLGLLIASIDKARELYSATNTQKMQEEIKNLQDENEKLKGKLEQNA
jgi:hypothetical protein